MLYGYPVVATAENWLHECLSAMLQTIHASLEANEDPPTWPQIIPGAYRARLRSRRGLRDRLDLYIAAAAAMSSDERARVISALNDQNDIPGLLSCVCDCAALDDLPASVRGPIRNLFGFAFELLTDLGVRDRQYAAIHAHTRYHVCPFCGCEYFSSPKSAREALDHYLAESKYPLAAANLRNLAPIGNKCNSGYKLSKDILRRDDGARRRSFDPYSTQGVRIALTESEVNGELNGPLISVWRIDFSEDTEEAETWNSVFSIRQRYEWDFLRSSFDDWLWEFRDWCRSALLADAEDQSVIDAIDRYTGFLSACGLNDRAFLKASVFRMLLRHCHEGQQRIMNVMRDLVRSGIAQNV